jgi:5-methylcytosine-specific restriction endonuclease McrA
VCYLKDTAGRHLGSRRRWKELQELFERQGRRCALSGVPLTLGCDTEVDHIVPRSRGGANDITNLQP